ncbi:MAG TPA: SDR family oxidoreductase [Chitinophagaceae bacterium]|nr:SDR family oxidoreductase [Chitinophagaceae bacterium]
MKILLTGGAGFIGSNLAKSLLQHPQVTKVKVIDNFSTGFRHNIESLFSNPNFELIEGDITDFKTCESAMQDIDIVSHQAALGSVPRSIQDPVATNHANITGSLNIFTAAKNANIKRIVYAASSSTYGDSESLPKVEDTIGRPLSPYAVTKFVMELYADVFGKTYDMEFIGLRYFNVFGPHQSPKGAYAAVIPLFMDAVIQHEAPTINGDGSYSRDFTYVDNVVEANINAIFTENKEAINQVYNIAFGESTTLLSLYDEIRTIANSDLAPKFGSFRKGDIPHSLANIDKAKRLLNYNPSISVKEGLKLAFEWYKENR